MILSRAITDEVVVVDGNNHCNDKEKRNFSWIVARSMAKDRKKRSRKKARFERSAQVGSAKSLASSLTNVQVQIERPAQAGSVKRFVSSLMNVQVRIRSFTEAVKDPFVSDIRKQQLSEFAASDSIMTQKVQETAKKNLLISSFSLLLASGGALFFAPLYMPAILGTLYTVKDFCKDAWSDIIEKRRITANVYVAVLYTSCLAGGFYFPMTLGLWYGHIMRWILTKTEKQSRKNLVNLFGEQPRSVWVMVDGDEVEIPFESIQQGDQVVVVAGQMIPVDGIINAGMASIDQHMLTGESQPFEAGPSEKVFASTVVSSGKITIQVEKTGQETVAAHIGEILNNCADFDLNIKSRVESFLDRTVPGLLVLSGASLPWLGVSGALGILWSCPGYRMFILAPMSMLNFLHIYSRQGILIKDSASLELLNQIDVVVFDKTGTLTVGQPTVNQILSCSTLSASQILTLAVAAEHRQTHPIALAILQAANEHKLEVPEIDHAHYEIGYGIKVNLNGNVIRVGSERFMQMSGITIPASICEEQARCEKYGYSLVYVATDEQLSGVIELMPTIRPETLEVIRTLRESGKTLYIISGDHEVPTRRLAQELGIGRYFANTLPENKAELVKQLQEEGHSVCFVGDGINDAIALKQADISISLCGAAAIATDTAQIVLMGHSLKQLPYLFETAKEFNRNLNKTFIMTLVPQMLYIGTTLLFHWGVFTAIIINSSLWLPQLANVMHPLYKNNRSGSP